MIRYYLGDSREEEFEISKVGELLLKELSRILAKTGSVMKYTDGLCWVQRSLTKIWSSKEYLNLCHLSSVLLCFLVVFTTIVFSLLNCNSPKASLCHLHGKIFKVRHYFSFLYFPYPSCAYYSIGTLLLLVE